MSDLDDCRAALRGGSRTFFAASLLLPRHVHEPATALYAFCRLADDAVDVDAGDGRTAKLATLGRLRERLARAYDGRPLQVPADRALADVLARFPIPRALPEALLEGFEWDASGRVYDDLPELHAYAARVAGTVGAMMAVLMGVRAPEVVARACDLGMAMQLSNIARDVGEDAREGRLYLPLQWLREAGIDPQAWLARPLFSPALGEVVRRVLQAADALYERAAPGIARLPLLCRPGIGAARFLYAEIGHEVARRGLDSVSARAVVSGRRKALVLARAVANAVLPDRRTLAHPVEEARFLVDAVVAHTAWPARRPPRPSIDDRIGWVVELFDRLEQREQMGRSGS